MSKSKNNFSNKYYRIPNFARKKFKLSVFQFFVSLQIDIYIRKNKTPFQLKPDQLSEYFECKKEYIKYIFHRLKEKNVIQSYKRGYYELTDEFIKAIRFIPYVEVIPELKEKFNLKTWNQLYYLLFVYTVSDKGNNIFNMSRENIYKRTGFGIETQIKLEDYLCDEMSLLIKSDSDKNHNLFVENHVKNIILEVKNSVKIYHDTQRSINQLSENQEEQEKKVS